MAIMVVTIFITLTVVRIITNAYELPTVITIGKNSVDKQKIEATKGAFEGDILLPPPSKARGLAAIGTSVRWSDGIVPYVFAPGYTADQEAAIVSRMRKLESFTAINNVRCVQFRPKVSSDVYYITIHNGIGCSSHVGQNTGVTMERTVTLQYPSCFDDGRIMHEFIHTLGFYHEQSRPDRDSYVRINLQNMQAGLEPQFTKYQSTAVNTQNIPYDYASLMHYKKTDFSANGLPTIEPLVPNVKIGQRYKLAPTDIQAIRTFYSCTASGATLPPITKPVPPTTPSTFYSSELTSNNRIFARSGGFGTNYYYEVIQVTIPVAGSYIFECTSTIDTFASLYTAIFDPSNPAANLFTSFDDSGDDNWEFKFQINFSSAYTMYLVVTTYSPNVLGPFSIVTSGPARAIFTRMTATGNPTSTTTTLTTRAVTTVATGGFQSANMFYPATLTQATCSNGYSWTMWFNVGRPNITSGGDRENTSIILSQYPTAMCRTPSGVQAQPINARVVNWRYGWWPSPLNNSPNLVSFQSSESNDIDFRVRYCCPIGSFIAPTITTTTPRPLDSITCGKQTIAPRSRSMNRIFGGTNAIPNSWPWMIYYKEKKPGNNNLIGVCGGTLISTNYVITAAHCIENNDPSSITLIAGVHNRTSNTETTQQQRSVQTIYIHPQYDRTTGSIYDIAVLRVSTPFQLNTYVQPACLPGAEPQANDPVTIVGWGALSLSGSVNDILKQASTKIVGDCGGLWSTVDNSRQICIADSINGNSACRGDNGGPILSLYQGRYVVSGIASFVSDCNTAGATKLPNVYIRVAAYKTWIKSITG